jgi:hypothetical protein
MLSNNRVERFDEQLQLGVVVAEELVLSNVKLYDRLQMVT